MVGNFEKKTVERGGVDRPGQSKKTPFPSNSGGSALMVPALDNLDQFPLIIYRESV